MTLTGDPRSSLTLRYCLWRLPLGEDRASLQMTNDK